MLLVAPVLDLAVVVIVLRLVQGINLGEIHSDGAYVVGDDVDHHPNSSGVSSIDELLQVALGAEVFVDFLPVGSPVAVVATIQVFDDWRNPDGVESHALDVVKVVSDSFPSSTTVSVEITTSTRVSVVFSESVGNDLIDCSLFPFFSASSKNSSAI